MARVLRRRHRGRRPSAGPLPDAQAARTRPRTPGRRPGAAQHGLHQHRSRPSASRGSPATRRSSAGSGPTSGGTRRSWSPAPTRRSASAATSPPTPPPRRCTRSASTTSSAARTSPAAMGDQVYFQGHAAPGIYARAFLEGRLTEQHLDGFRQEQSHAPFGLSSYPHPRLMPDFWEFPTVSMGLGPIGAIYQARFNRYLQRPRHHRHHQLARLGVPRRRRDGRGRVARRDRPGRARGTGQPHLRHQLQPAAPGRPGARQRQDHPGAGVLLPGRRLERASR